MTTLQGIVCAGKGKARAFTQLAWVREQFRAKLGFDPYPGTLNLRVDPTRAAPLRARPGIAIEPTPGFCAARCYRARVNGTIAAAWILPAVPGYPDDMIELMAPVFLRQVLGVGMGDVVQVEIED